MDYINEDLYKYLKKLVKTIETQASFSIGNIRILNQTRIDDILCCIDINFPKILNKYRKEYEIENMPSLGLYNRLIAIIKKRPPFIKTIYIINYSEVLKLTEQLKEVLVKDITYVVRTHPELLEDN